MDRDTGKLTPFDQHGVQPDLSGTHRRRASPTAGVPPDGRALPVRRIRARSRRRALRYSRERIRAIAAELARVAFDEAFELDHEWTDFRGEKHDKMIGRPVSFHAMRGISAHSNGFQTCRALHVLQILLGTVEVPGGFRFKPPYPKPATPTPSRTAA